MNDRMDFFRARIFGQYPLFSRFLYKDWIPNIDIPTLQTDGVDVWYNPEFFNDPQWSDNDREFFVMHELAHIFLGHTIRYNPDLFPDVELYRSAVDYAANDLLKSCELRLWEHALWSYRFTDMAWEEIYRILEKDKKSSKQLFKLSKPGLNDDIIEHPDYSPKPEDNDDPLDNNQSPEQKQKRREKKQQELENELSEQRDQAINRAKMQGNLPRGLERILHHFIQSQFDWRTLLAEFFVKSAGMEDYTYQKPNIAYDNEDDIIMPSLESEEAPAMVFVGDTSASITDEEMRRIAGDAMKIMETVEPEELICIWCDAAVKGVQRFTAYDVVEPRPVGGGGTSFKPPFQWCHDNNIDVTCLVYLTDGECNSYPDVPPSYPVLWLVHGYIRDFKPPFGEVVRMKL